MANFHTQRIVLDSFRVMISSLIAELSIGRAQMVVEQIRRVAEAGQLDRLVILTTSETGPVNQPFAAVVAVLQPGLGGHAIGDVATVVHAGKLRDFDGIFDDLIISDLSTALDREFRELGINFVQWATDEVKTEGSSSRPSSNWCDRFGFQPIGTLEYLCGPVPNDPGHPFGSQRSDADRNRPLQFHPVSWKDTVPWKDIVPWKDTVRQEDSTAFDQLVQLVGRTYVETLDCPDLSKFRNTVQVLEGYQTSEAFDPSLWFTVTDPKQGNSRERNVGCAILATHRATEPSTNSTSSGGSVEIVYMGLVPEARGSGFGKQLVQKSFDVARQIGAEQVLLAVDRINYPAKSIYQLAGLRPIVHETIWVKSIGS